MSDSLALTVPLQTLAEFGPAVRRSAAIAFPGLKGCNWFAKFDIELPVSIGASGTVTVPLPIPTTASLAGVRVDTQVLGFQGTTPLMSKACVIALEKN